MLILLAQESLQRRRNDNTNILTTYIHLLYIMGSVLLSLCIAFTSVKGIGNPTPSAINIYENIRYIYIYIYIVLQIPVCLTGLFCCVCMFFVDPRWLMTHNKMIRYVYKTTRSYKRKHNNIYFIVKFSYMLWNGYIDYAFVDI